MYATPQKYEPDPLVAVLGSPPGGVVDQGEAEALPAEGDGGTTLRPRSPSSAAGGRQDDLRSFLCGAPMVTKDLYKGGKVFFYGPPDGKPVEMVILMNQGPLCVARVYDHLKKELVVGLYWIYLKKHGAHMGPFYTDIHLAYKAMKKILKHFGENFFEQPLDWIRRQDTARIWMDKNIGKITDLVGGEWEKPADSLEHS